MSLTRPLRTIRVCLKCTAACCTLVMIAATAGDWPQFRGPNQDGVSSDRIVKDWSGSVTNPVWLVPISNSLCGFAVSGGRAFSQINQRLGAHNQSNPSAYTNREVCVAYSITNGAPLWATMVESNAFYGVDTGFIGPDDGPRTTPSVDGSAVYVLTSFLKLYKLNVTDGAVIWQTNLLTGFGGTIPRFQNAASPLIDAGLIYLNANCVSNALMALSTTNADVVWRSQNNEGLTHSTPVLATIHGVRQLLFATSSGIVSLNPLTGGKLWKFNYPFPYQSLYSLAVSPVVDQNLVFMSGTRSISYSSVVAQVTFSNSAWTTQQLWVTRDPSTTFTTPVVRDGFLYGTFGFDRPDNELKCVEMRTGSVRWSEPGFGRGGVLLVDDRLMVLTETGQLVLAEVNTNAYVELGRFQALPPYNSSTNKCWNVPAVADGRVYVRSTSFGAAYDFSIPALKLDPPQPAPLGKFEITVRTANGSPIDLARFTNLEVRVSSQFNLSPAAWPKLTNLLSLTNGVVLVTNVDVVPPGQFFMVREPK